MEVPWRNRFPGRFRFPAMVWDPRFLDVDKSRSHLVEQSWNVLGKRHVVRLFDAKNEFILVGYE